MEKGAVLNWWDIVEIDGYASLNTRLKVLIEAIGAETTGAMLIPVMGTSHTSPTILNLSNNMTVMRFISLICGSMNIEVTKEQLLDLNADLNKIAIK